MIDGYKIYRGLDTDILIRIRPDTFLTLQKKNNPGASEVSDEDSWIVFFFWPLLTMAAAAPCLTKCFKCIRRRSRRALRVVTNLASVCAEEFSIDLHAPDRAARGGQDQDRDSDVDAEEDPDIYRRKPYLFDPLSYYSTCKEK